MNDKIIVGLVEEIFMKAKEGEKKIFAKIDSGASRSSIDLGLISELKTGGIKRTTFIKSAHGNSLRPVVELELKLKGKPIKAEFTIADRRHMKYPVLIGVNILKHGYLIDPSKSK